MKKILLVILVASLSAGSASATSLQDDPKTKKECCNKKCDDKCKEQCCQSKCTKEESAKCEEKKNCTKTKKV